MALCFLILLCACLFTSYFLLKKINHEVSHLVAVFAAISLILGLIIAPWQILLVLLISVFISTSYEHYTSNVLTKEIECPEQLVDKSEANCGLMYRGASYHADHNAKSDRVTISPATYKLSFRGSTYFVCANSNTKTDEVTTDPISYKLSFRGSTYSVNRTAHQENKEQ